jgi:2,3-bisphosphoglycerate-independent phosphoglycerate mutase
MKSMTENTILRPLVVTILDGWGISFIEQGNAILAADTPYMDMFPRHYPSATLSAAGIEVGLPWGEKGNSETGHSNIGAGRVQYQSLPRIDQAIRDGSLYENPVLLETMNHAQRNRSDLHLIGLVSSGGVHSHINHVFALLQMAKQVGLGRDVYVHMFADGRDTPPQSAKTYLHQLEEKMGSLGVGRIASVTGRFYAMDRNQNWDRTEMTFRMLTGQERAATASTPEQAIEQAYGQGLVDEAIPPTVITRGGAPIATIKEKDAVLFFNFRPDRARQLTRAFVLPDFNGFERPYWPDLMFATLEQYDADLPAQAAFIEEPARNPLAKVLSQAGLRQLHIAETEKYAHVTYYLNGGHEQPFPGEEHIMIKSSSVKDFANEPHMEAEGLTDRLIEELGKNVYDVVFVNYANVDMVGHTGNYEAAVEACTFVDMCVGRLYEYVKSIGGSMMITADHGNAEEMTNPQTGEKETDHTSNPVPFYYINERLRRVSPRGDDALISLYSSPIGMLADIAPTILDVFGLEKPTDWTGISLLNSLQ